MSLTTQSKVRPTFKINRKKCVVCRERHPVAYCPVFKSKQLQERRKLAWEHKLCFNCLKGRHQAKCCPSKKRCLKEHCSLPHHTLLHEGHQAHSNPDYPTDTHSSTPRTSVPPQDVARRSGPSPSSLTTAESNVHQVCVQPR